jgi:hypothetical protein
MKSKILKGLKQREEKLLDAIYELQEYLDSTEDATLSSMGAELSDYLLDIVNDNDVITINNIREYLEDEYEG